MQISIITINYNNKDGLRKTIESVINQSYRDYEYIIIDGGSTDGSVKVIEQYSDKIAFWVSEKDHGIYNAMNKGTKQAKGEYVLYLNSGDCLYDKHTLEVVSKNFGKDVLLGWRKTDKGIIETFNKNITALSVFENGFFHQSAYIKRELALKYPYNEQRKIVSDWQFFFKSIILDDCTYEIIEAPLCLYDTSGISSTNTHEAFREKGELLKEMLPEKIYVDYQRFLRIDSPILELIPEFYKYTNLHQLIYKINLYIVKLHKVLLKWKR